MSHAMLRVCEQVAAAQYRSVLLASATGELRTAKFQEREHLILPVIMMVEGVVHAVNAEQPELVLAEEFGRAFGGWNGRPVTLDHPVSGGKHVSANDPRILEAYAVGNIFNAKLLPDRLAAEAWIDIERAMRSTEGANLVERARNKEPIEVSVGAITVTEAKEGTFKGEKYYGIWRNIVPDHLAMLPKGTRGACSNDMGCGVRAATVHIVTAQGLEIQPMNEKERNGDKKPLRERLLSLFTFRSGAGAEDLSDHDLRSALDRALNSTEPGFLGIDSVFPGDSRVVYAVAPEDRVIIYRRSYSVAEDRTITLGDDREEVKPVTVYEPVKAAAAETADSRAAACGCGGDHPSATSAGGTMKTKEERIKALLEHKKLGLTDASRQALEAMPDETLTALEQAAALTTEPKAAATEPKAEQPKAEQQTQAAPQAETKAAAQAPLTAEQFIAQAPVEIQESLREGMRAAAERRNGFIAALKASGRCKFTDEQLAAKSTTELEQLVELAGAAKPDVQVAGVLPRAAGSGDEKKAPPAPPSLIGSIRAARGLDSGDKK